MWIRRAVVVLVLPAAWLVVPQPAHAAFVPSTSGFTATLTGTSAAESVTIGASGGLLTHNLPLSGNLISQFDWDPVTAGDQAVSASSSVTLVVNAGDGDDQIVIDTTVSNVHPQLNGDGGNDLITGGLTADQISGGAGDDVLTGRPGADTMAGGIGDDTFIWNSGDGSDVVDGNDGFDTVQVNTSPTAGDTLILKPNGGRARLDRTNLGPFGIDFTAERLNINSLGGNDAVTVQPGTPTLPILDGGAGDDTFEVRDGAATYVFGGSGTDRATTDVPALDPTNSVESVDAAPGGVTISAGTKAKKGKLALTLSCPAGVACAGEVQALTKKAVRLGGVKAKAVLGSGTYAVAAGGAQTLQLKLAKGYKSLAKRHKLALLVVTHGTDGSSVSQAVTLKL